MVVIPGAGPHNGYIYGSGNFAGEDKRMRGECPGWPDCGCGTQSGPHTCEWRAECERRYRKLGIDVNHPDRDGSDYHLMNAIDDKVTREWKERRV